MTDLSATGTNQDNMRLYIGYYDGREHTSLRGFWKAVDVRALRRQERVLDIQRVSGD